MSFISAMLKTYKIINKFKVAVLEIGDLKSSKLQIFCYYFKNQEFLKFIIICTKLKNYEKCKTKI